MPERCIELGLRFDGLATRTQMWLIGACHGVAFCKGKTRLNLFLANKQAFFVETNSQRMIEQVSDHVNQYGCTVTPVAPPIPNCPACNGERELSGSVAGGFECHFCGLTTT